MLGLLSNSPSMRQGSFSKAEPEKKTAKRTCINLQDPMSKNLAIMACKRYFGQRGHRRWSDDPRTRLPDFTFKINLFYKCIMKILAC